MPYITRRATSAIRHRLATMAPAQPSLDAPFDIDITEADIRADLDFGRD